MAAALALVAGILAGILAGVLAEAGLPRWSALPHFKKVSWERTQPAATAVRVAPQPGQPRRERVSQTDASTTLSASVAAASWTWIRVEPSVPPGPEEP
ncbi:colipase-like protein 2 isoform X1 [Callithrix jacchus]